MGVPKKRKREDSSKSQNYYCFPKVWTNYLTGLVPNLCPTCLNISIWWLSLVGKKFLSPRNKVFERGRKKHELSQLSLSKLFCIVNKHVVCTLSPCLFWRTLNELNALNSLYQIKQILFKTLNFTTWPVTTMEVWLAWKQDFFSFFIFWKCNFNVAELFIRTLLQQQQWFLPHFANYL